MEEFWKKSILENIPHGEESSLQLEVEEANKLIEILLHNGFAVCITGGDFGEKVRVSWLYAGDSDNLDWADYDNVVFTSVDYINDYPEAYYEEYIENEERKDM